jgi:hypothetical protein
MKSWIYHKTEQPKIIEESDYPEYEKDGWRDSPASFLLQSDFGIDREKMIDGDVQESMKAQQVYDAINGVRDYCNDVINLDFFTKKRLAEFAKKHLQTELNLNATKPTLLEKIRSKLGGNG